MKHQKIESLSEETIESIKKDRLTHPIDELVFKYNVSAKNIAALCEGIKMQRRARIKKS